MSLQSKRVKAQDGKRKQMLKVHSPRNPQNTEEFVRFVNDINSQFALISDRLNTVENPAIDISNLVTTENLEERLATMSAEQEALASSEATDATGLQPDTSTSGSDNFTPFEEGAGALEDAVPTAAPPKIRPDVGQVGTTTDPPVFALSDHTHEGFTRATHFASPLQAGITSKKPIQDLAFRRTFLTMGAS